MKTRGKTSQGRWVIFMSCVVVVAFLPVFALSESQYEFKRMWPVQRQAWNFNSPYGVATGGGKFLYVVDTLNHRIQKFTLDGQFITTWGSRGDSDGQFDQPLGITSDDQGNIYVADSKNFRIQKFTPDGEHLISWGSQGSADGQFQWPGEADYLIGMAVDHMGRVYVTDAGNNRVQLFSSAGQFAGQWTESLDKPSGLAIDTEGNVVVLDQTNLVQKFTPEGVRVAQWGHGVLTTPQGIACDPAGDLYISDSANNQVSKFASNGTFLGALMGGYGACPGFCRGPFGLATDQSGNLYVADRGNSRIQKFDASGEFRAAWGGYGREPGELLWPGGIDLDDQGNVYVADVYNNRVQKFSPDGRSIALLGEVWADQFGLPSDIAVDAGGNVYVADTWYHRVRKLTSGFKAITEWGSYGSGNNQFRYPAGIAVDKAGNIFVADAGNHCIKKFTPEGVHLTRFGARGSDPGEFIWSESTGDDVFNGYWEVDFVVGMTVDSQNYLYVTDRGNHRIQRFTANGEFDSQFGQWGSGPGEFKYPSGIAIDGRGSIFVTDTGNFRIQEFSGSREFIFQWGVAGVQPGQMNMPVDVSVAANGEVYITDSGGNNHILVFEKRVPIGNKAIVVAGGGPYPGNNLWDATRMCANHAYRALSYQGYTKETIYYLSADTQLDLDGNGVFDDVDADATKANLQFAITEWGNDAHELFIYMVDHGGENTFRMSASELLEAQELDAWLDTVQQTIPGYVILVYDACRSGSFLPVLLPPPGKVRILATSANADQKAVFASDGTLSFSWLFWGHMFNGDSFYDSFVRAKNSMGLLYDQTSQIEADGNGQGNEKSDKEISWALKVGNENKTADDIPFIREVSPPVTLGGENSALIYAEGVIDSDGISRVWAVITPPGPLGGSLEEPVIDLPVIDLNPVGNNRFSAVYDQFSLEGVYQITLFAADKGGVLSLPKQTTVTKGNPELIKGRVTTSYAGHFDLGVADARVFLEDVGFSTTTDSDGYFKLINVPPGTYTLRVTAAGLTPLTREITVTAGQTDIADIPRMTPGALCTPEELDRAVLDERRRWDVNNDNQKGLPEAIDALQVISGIKPQ